MNGRFQATALQQHCPTLGAGRPSAVGPSRPNFGRSERPAGLPASDIGSCHVSDSYRGPESAYQNVLTGMDRRELPTLAAPLGLCCLMERGEVFTSLWSHQMLHKDPEAMYRVLTCGGVGSDHVSPQFFK